ncbi:hypothetical protein AAFP30_17375 [Gordonia sp. CPCC 205515]|uniref:hypothetical protein n=1 Tax=Gordonia sp. CPCC 205515 TaxID=3140791 RepID=UPI003AF3ADF2
MTPSRRNLAKKLAVGALAAGSIMITGLGAGAGLASAAPNNPPSQQQQCDPKHPAPNCPKPGQPGQQGPQQPQQPPRQQQPPQHQTPQPQPPRQQPPKPPAPPQQHRPPMPPPPQQHRPMPPRPPQHRPAPPRRWLPGVVRHNLRPFWYRGQFVRPQFHRGWGWGFNYGPYWVPIYLR